MAETVKITKALALRLLKEAVEKKGADYVDPASQDESGDVCTYANGQRPGCIVGHALYGAGVKPKTLREVDDCLYTSFLTHAGLSASDRKAGQGVVAALAQRGVIVTDKAAEVFGAAQAKQDIGKTWGEALTAARKA